MTRALAALATALLFVSCSQDEAAQPDTPKPDSAEASPAPAPAAEPSRYTSLADCRLLRSNPEEGGFYEHECPGESGYRLRKVQSDLRDDVVVLSPQGAEARLGLPALANGAFSSVGDTAEWRGDASEPFAPRALILRHSVMEDPDPAVPEVSYLVVARLAPQPCVIARIAPGPDQNGQARQAADGEGPCLASPG